LFLVDSLDVLDYIRQSVEILMNMKGDEQELFQKNKELQESLRRKHD